MSRILDERDKQKLESNISTTAAVLNKEIENLDEKTEQNLSNLNNALTNKVNTLDNKLTNKVDTLEDDVNAKINTLSGNVSAQMNELDTDLTTQINSLDTEMSTKITTLEGTLTNTIDTLDTELTKQISDLDQQTDEKMQTINTNITTLRNDITTELGSLAESTNTQISVLGTDMTTTINNLDTELSAQIGVVDGRVTTLQEGLTTSNNNFNDKIYTIENQLSSLEITTSTKVNMVEGKDLSENDLTDELKENYDDSYEHSLSAHAPIDAEMNVQANWAEEDSTHDSYIQNKPVLGSIAAKNVVEKSDLSTEVQASLLPVITAEDEGKILCVVNGVYKLVDITSLIPSVGE